METIQLSTLITFAINFIFLILFGTAALDKWKSLKTPAWFVKEFEQTIISKMPGGATAGYWIIAVIELTLTIGFLSAFLNPALLPLALVGALFLFGFLCFGLRVSGDYQGSANTFIYFATALISLTMIS